MPPIQPEQSAKQRPELPPHFHRSPLSRARRRVGGLLALAGVSVFGTGCTAFDVLNTLADAPPGPSTAIRYGDHPRQALDLYLPAGASAKSPAPILVFFYGGSWNAGSRTDYRFVAEAFVTQGYAVALPDYRLTPEVTYPDFLIDSAAAIQALHQQARALGADPSRMVLMGHSAGAYNAAMLTYDKRWLSSEHRRAIRGFVGLAGPYDFLPIAIPSVQTTFNWPNTPRDTQPVEHVRPGDAPALLMVATKDSLVDPITNTRALEARMLQAEVPVQVLAYDRVGHASLIASLVPPISALASVRADTLRFLKDVLPANSKPFGAKR